MFLINIVYSTLLPKVSSRLLPPVILPVLIMSPLPATNYHQLLLEHMIALTPMCSMCSLPQQCQLFSCLSPIKVLFHPSNPMVSLPLVLSWQVILLLCSHVSGRSSITCFWCLFYNISFAWSPGCGGYTLHWEWNDSMANWHSPWWRQRISSLYLTQFKYLVLNMIPTFQVQFRVATQVVWVYLDDHCNLRAVAKSSVEVMLTVADNHDCGPREWCVDAQDLLVQLLQVCFIYYCNESGWACILQVQWSCHTLTPSTPNTLSALSKWQEMFHWKCQRPTQGYSLSVSKTCFVSLLMV